jgi:hypothetical protein
MTAVSELPDSKHSSPTAAANMAPDEKPATNSDEKYESSLVSTAWDKYKEFEAFRYRM